MKAGKLNQRITINFPGTKVSDGMGGFTEGDRVGKQVWGSARQLSLKEVLLYGLDSVYASFEFRFRYEAAKDVNNSCTLTYDNRTFSSPHITDVNEAKTEIKIIANEHTT